jgi:carbon-monoxide dehydrogenase medium subunit
MKKGFALPDYFISIERIDSLDHIDYDEKAGLRIGSLTTLLSIENSDLIQSKFRVLSQAASTLGPKAIRNRATIGGNLCNAAPSADAAPALMVLGASVKIRGVEGERLIPIENFFTGPGQTHLGNNQILTEILVPNLPPDTGAVYLKETRTRGADLAIVGVAALVTTENDVIKDVKIAIGAAAPTPIRAKKAEKILKGKKPDEELLQRAGQSASEDSNPIDDVRASADYRHKLVSVLVKRAVKQAADRARMEG